MVLDVARATFGVGCDGLDRPLAFELTQVGQYLAVHWAQEALGPAAERLVLLTDLGYQFLDSDMAARKALLSQQLRNLGTFQYVIRILQEAKARRLPQDVVEEELAYGMESFGLGQRLNIPTAEAQVILDAYFEAFPSVRDYMDRVVAEALLPRLSALA